MLVRAAAAEGEVACEQSHHQRAGDILDHRRVRKCGSEKPCGRDVDAVAKRRADWRLGRWTAKRVVARLGSAGDPARVSILADASGAPVASNDGNRLALTVSISHAAGHGLCMVVPAPYAMGCDIEAIAERSAAFVGDYFTVAEQAAVASADARLQPILATLVWSAKEAALKALREGLRLDTRAVEVVLGRGPTAAHWQPMTVIVPATNRRFAGWWRREQDFVLTVAASPALDAPQALEG